ncbi:MAG: choice-of-anchor Q domain-containing protein, partial [Planctomycetota bacterium]
MATRRLAISIILLLAGSAAGRLITVDDDGTADFATIQRAINDANDGDTIEVQPGRYTGEGNRDIDFLGKAITVRSIDPNDPGIVARTIIDCQSLGRGFYFHNKEDANSILAGVTITNGYAEDGAGIYCGGADPMITNCMFLGNHATHYGAGVYCSYADPTIIKCIFVGNRAAGNGGGMTNYDSSPAILNCKFIENEAIGWGGAMMNRYSSPTIINCTFKENSCREAGGGICNSGSQNVLILNCLFAHNQAQGSQGYASAVHNSGSVKIVNCTIAANLSSHGSAVRSQGYGSPHITIANSIIRGNQPSQISGSEYEVSYSNIEGGWPGEGNIDSDPCFAYMGYVFDPCTPDDPCDDTLVIGDYHLLPGSPCIDAGDNTAVPPARFWLWKDLDGYPRFADDPSTADTGSGAAPIVDMGAYEGTGDANILTVSTEEIAVPEGGTAEFTVCISSAISEPVEAVVTLYFGDPDITIKSGAVLLFDANNYAEPQTVTLQAAEDDFFEEGKAYIRIEAENCITAVVTATEADNEPPVNTIYVAQNTDGTNNGMNWKNAYSDLQTAIAAAEQLAPLIDEIHVAQGTYTPAEPFSDDRNAAFRLVSGVAMKGGYAGYHRGDPSVRDIRKYETILSGEINGDDGPDFANIGDNSIRVVYGGGADANTVLDGFTITKGLAGFRADSYTSFVLRNCTISLNNSADRGGGIFLSTGYWQTAKFIIEGCTISGNTARWDGGAIYQEGISSLKIINSLIIGNRSIRGRGGAIYGRSPDLTISGSTISDNIAGERAGAVFCAGSSPVISSSIFRGNSAPISPQMVMENCLRYWDEPNCIPVAISYSNIQGGESAINVEENCSLDWGPGNIDADPCFAKIGYWHLGRDGDDPADDIWIG